MTNNKIALITGTGMDSKTMVHFLLRKGYSVIMTYRRNASQNLDNIRKLFEDDLSQFLFSSLDFIFMEITDQSSIRYGIKSILENPKYGKIDELYNFAAQSHVGFSFQNPTYTMQASGVSMFYILEAIKELSPRTKVFQACTSEMFGGNPANCPFSEESQFECRSPYAVAKKVSYQWVQYFRQTYNLFVSAAFCFNHSNVYRHPEFYIQKCCLAATKISIGSQSKLILGNLSFARDETYSDFCIETFWKMLQLPNPEDFVIGRGESFTGEQILDLAFSHYNLDWKKYVEQDKSLFRDNEVVKLVANANKARKILGFKPERMSIETHIGIMCDYNYNLETGNKINYPNVFKFESNSGKLLQLS